ncbi:MAG TPA: DnaJ domain-containing protein [Deltaproteobacteria bacterium]|nr:DnaJ domain-containing protein [Deltaproteobacteria bacterium]
MEQIVRFEDIAFPLVMKDVTDTLFTGILFVSHNTYKKGLIFNEGRLCAIQSNRIDELLGNILVDMGIISLEENLRSLATTRLERRKQGVVLLEMGLVQPREIAEAVRLQTEKRFLDIFSWENGIVQKVAKTEINKHPELGKNDLTLLIRKGIMEYAPFSVVIAALSPFADAIPKVMVDNLPGDSGLDMDYIRRYTVSEILLLGQDPPRVLLGLYCSGVVSFEESTFKALIETLRQKLKDIKDKDPFEVLGVDRQISEGGLKRAYIKTVKANHPDTYAYADDPEVKRLANEVFTEIQKAYTHINKIREGKPIEEPKGIDESLQAEILFSKATEFLKSRDYQNALDHFKLAATLMPEERIFKESYVKTLYLRFQNTGSGNPLEIKSAIREGLQRFPNSDTLYVIYGWLLKKEGSRKALDAFQRALDINRDNIDAQRELRLYQMRENR